MRIRNTWLSLSLLVLPLGGAQAQEPLVPAQALVSEPRSSLQGSWLADPDETELELLRETRAWRRLYMNRSGFELRRSLEVGEREIEMGVKGPLMKRKRVGLAFELKF